MAQTTFVPCGQPSGGCAPYHNSTRTHLLTHSSSGLEPGPDSDRATSEIPAAQLHTSSPPPITSQHSPFPHTSIHCQWRPQPLMPVGIHLQPCWAASDLPAALASAHPRGLNHGTLLPNRIHGAGSGRPAPAVWPATHPSRLLAASASSGPTPHRACPSRWWSGRGHCPHSSSRRRQERVVARNFSPARPGPARPGLARPGPANLESPCFRRS
jgi:hypothetical protein